MRPRALTLLVVLSCLVPLAAAQQRRPAPMMKSVDVAALGVVRTIRAQQWRRLAEAIDPQAGLVVANTTIDTSVKLSKAQFARGLRSRRQYTWIPAFEGDGGMREAHRTTLPGFLKELTTRDWQKAPRKARDRSIEPGAYRTLFIADFKKKAPQAKFVEYFFGNPEAGGEGVFDAALMLGFVRRGTEWRLVAIGFDTWKD